jgi:hypothetical protein
MQILEGTRELKRLQREVQLVKSKTVKSSSRKGYNAGKPKSSGQWYPEFLPYLSRDSKM